VREYSDAFVREGGGHGALKREPGHTI